MKKTPEARSLHATSSALVSLPSLEDERLFTLQRMELLGRLFTRLLHEPPQRMARELSRFDLAPDPKDDPLEGSRVTTAIQLASSWMHLRLRRHEYEIQARPDAPPVPITTTLLAQAIANLLDNAIDAIEERARVAGEIADDAEGCVSLAHSFSSAGQTIAIHDDGAGVASAAKAKLFTPLASPKTDASGLGLYVSRKILLAAGGEVDLRKTGARGSVFEITVPSLRRVAPGGRA